MSSFSRRDFLKLGGTLGAGFLLGACSSCTRHAIFAPGQGLGGEPGGFCEAGAGSCPPRSRSRSAGAASGRGLRRSSAALSARGSNTSKSATTLRLMLSPNKNSRGGVRNESGSE